MYRKNLILSLVLFSGFASLSAKVSQAQSSASVKDAIVEKAVSEWKAFGINTVYPSGIVLHTPAMASKVDGMHLELLDARCGQINKFWNALPSRDGVISSNAEYMQRYYSLINLKPPIPLPPGTSSDGRHVFDTCQWPKQILPGNASIPGTTNKHSFWDLYPWSAAFISYVFNSSDPLKRFPASAGHWEYINRAIRAENTPNAPFQAVDATKSAPRVGDLLCASRNARPMSYQDIRTHALARKGYESHCDLVVAVRPGTIEVIGGNVSDSIARTILPADSKGVAMMNAPNGWSPEEWVKWRKWRPWAVIIRTNLP